MFLDCKDQFQVLEFIPVIQETIVPDFQETGGQHMHQVTPDEFQICQCERLARLAGLLSLAEKVT